jgi:hypothetical protein
MIARPGGPTCRSKRQSAFHSPGSVESPPLEDVVVLVDSAGIALGVQRAFSARVRGVRDGGSGLIASRYVEIALVGSDGEVSGILYHTRPAARHARRGCRWRAFLNKLSLDGTLTHLVLVSDPRTMGETRKHFHRDLRGKIIGELAKDFSRRPLEDIASLISNA